MALEFDVTNEKDLGFNSVPQMFRLYLTVQRRTAS